MRQALASSGVASRRACIDLVKAGKVQVNGSTVTDPATKVRATQQHELDGPGEEVDRRALLSSTGGTHALRPCALAACNSPA